MHHRTKQFKTSGRASLSFPEPKWEGPKKEKIVMMLINVEDGDYDESSAKIGKNKVKFSLPSI